MRTSAGVPLTTIPVAPAASHRPRPNRSLPEESPPPDTLVDLPIPLQLDLIPNPLDWLPGSLSPNFGRGTSSTPPSSPSLPPGDAGSHSRFRRLGARSRWVVTQLRNTRPPRAPTTARRSGPSTTSPALVVNVALAVIVMWGGFSVIIKEHTFRSPYPLRRWRCSPASS